MNGIEDLRSTLDRHAADVVDHDLGGRVGSVHQRVRVVRRRRRAGAAGALAATLAVVGGVALLAEPSPREDLPAASVVGVPVPSSMKSLGYTYGFDRSVEGDGKATVRLDDSDTPRLVSWGTAGEDDRVRVTQSGDVSAYDVPDFSDFVWVSPGDGISVSVAGTGAVGLAVYELTDEQPAGMTGAGVTFRETVGDDRLLGATIGEPGESEVTVSAEAAGTSLEYRFFCAHGPENATLHVDDGSGEIFGSSCADEAPFDPGSGTSYGVDNVQDRDLTVRLWVTDGDNGPVLDSDEVVLGLGVYENGDSTRVYRFDVPQVFEYGGHLWEPFSYAATDPGHGALEENAEGDATRRPLLAVGYYAAEGATVVMEHNVTGESSRIEGVSEGGNGVIGLLSQPSDSALIRVLGDIPDDARLMIVRFEQVD